ncbi:MAG: hypothetical protein ACERKY_09035, partial [Anaerolineales bacterium]
DDDVETLGMFATVGLREFDGTPKPALALWDEYRANRSDECKVRRRKGIRAQRKEGIRDRGLGERVHDNKAQGRIGTKARWKKGIGFRDWG